MSGTRFSGIAVAAANRKALANQEREAALRDASLTHKLSSREEALLASLKSELLRGGGGGARVGGAALEAGPGERRPLDETTVGGREAVRYARRARGGRRGGGGRGGPGGLGRAGGRHPSRGRGEDVHVQG